jgi:hypothetical protein
MGIIKANRGKAFPPPSLGLLLDRDHDDGNCHHDDRDEEQGYERLHNRSLSVARTPSQNGLSNMKCEIKKKGTFW